MKKNRLTGIDLDVYEKTLKNGLHVIIVPYKLVNNAYVTYSTKFGSNDFEFYKDGKLIKTPEGVAHFLEHKMFENEDGVDVFNYFQKRGANCNANTTNNKTTYLFSGNNKFYENLKFLLKYVEEPYFTDENVNKEKGIIEQEIMMYKDNPYSRIYEGLLNNVFINDPTKIPVIGTKKSVYSTTKEDLYDCYNTFYHPSNMFIIVTGNVDYEKTLEVIEEHENSRNIGKAPIIKRKEIDEPDEVEKKHETLHLDITIPKIAIAYKINVKNFDAVERKYLYTVIYNVLKLKVGATSELVEKLKKDGLITDEFDIGIVKASNHFMITIDNETKFPKEVIKLLMEELKDLTITKEQLERKKKTAIASIILISDDIYNTNARIMNDIIDKNFIEYDPIKRLKNYEINHVNETIANIDFSNYSIFTVLPKTK